MAPEGQLPTYKVLVFGFRRGLIDALIKFSQNNKLEYALVLEKLPKDRPNVDIVKTKKFPVNIKEVEELLKPLKEQTTWTHVIACVEAAVLSASLARRVLNARLSQDTIILKCYDKYRMKEYLSHHSIPMTKFMKFKLGMSLDEYANLDFPVVSKKRISSGGRGIVIVENLKELEKILDVGRIYESFVEGEELSIETFIQDGKILFTNITKYYLQKFTNIVPANFNQVITQNILDLNAKILDALKISWGITHCEMFLQKDGSLCFGEIAIRPPGGQIMELISMSYGFDAWDTFLKIELGIPISLAIKPKSVSAVVFFHPGEGKIKNIQGNEQIKKLKCLVDYAINVKVGDKVDVRLGIGENVGQARFNAGNYGDLIADIEWVNNNLKFELN